LVYELLTGRSAFGRETLADTLVAAMTAAALVVATWIVVRPTPVEPAPPWAFEIPLTENSGQPALSRDGSVVASQTSNPFDGTGQIFVRRLGQLEAEVGEGGALA